MQKKVLFGVLNWGLGHATRSIPLIQKIIAQDYRVCIAGSGASLQFLKEYFPFLEFLELSEFEIKYSQRFSYFNWWKISFKMLFLYFKDRKKIKEIENNYDLIVSDNRYGFFSKKIKSIFITHQCTIILPKGFLLFKNMIGFFNQKILNQYAEIWIPDNQNSFLSGKLSKKCSHKNYKFIGISSRFNYSLSKKKDKYLKYDVLVILSGAEPYRTELESLLIEKLSFLKKKTLFIAGRPTVKSKIQSNYIDYQWHLSDEDFALAVNTIPYVIARSGYSTIMDLYALKRKALIIPTPNQSEQEYLADYLNKQALFLKCRQNQIKEWNKLPEIRI